MRDPLWLEGDDIAFDEEIEELEDDPDRLHDGFFDE